MKTKLLLAAFLSTFISTSSFAKATGLSLNLLLKASNSAEVIIDNTKTNFTVGDILAEALSDEHTLDGNCVFRGKSLIEDCTVTIKTRTNQDGPTTYVFKFTTISAEVPKKVIIDIAR